MCIVVDSLIIFYVLLFFSPLILICRYGKFIISDQNKINFKEAITSTSDNTILMVLGANTPDPK